MIDTTPYRVILLDVEGTTTPVRFVYEVLFPRSRARMASFLREHAGDAQVVADVASLRADHARDMAAGLHPPAWGEESGNAASAYALWLLAEDRKVTALKSLQGRIWAEGYADGTLRGQVYPDVPEAFARWTQSGKTLAIFSSGSVLAQRLIFTHSDAGDLERYLSAHFDTTTGAKAEDESYRRIVQALGRAPAEVLFFSDVTAELDAARRAGLGTALVVREAAVLPGEHPVVRDFSRC